MRFEMDESDHTAKEPTKWWELLDDSASFINFHYNEIQQHGSDELKRAAEIVLGGHRPGRPKEESA